MMTTIYQRVVSVLAKDIAAVDEPWVTFLRMLEYTYYVVLGFAVFVLCNIVVMFTIPLEG